MANEPCKKCQHYDVIKRGAAKDARHGWCAAQSKYPAQEQAGQTFPDGVARVAPGELAQPTIVIGSETIPHCEHFRSKT